MDSITLENLVDKLSLTEEADDDPVVLSSLTQGESSTRLKRCLIGKIFSNRAVNRETLLLHAPRILQTRGTVVIEVMGDNLFVLECNNPLDKNRVLEEGPWNFFNDLMAFKEPTDLNTASDLEFKEVQLWVQFYNLPIACMHESAIRELASRVGKVIRVDTDEGGRCFGKFARARVERPLDIPLKRCIRTATAPGGNKGLILLKHEKLPDFCYVCGRIGHCMRDCTAESVDKTKPGFGSWLRAQKSEWGRWMREPSRGSQRGERGLAIL